MVFIHRLYTGVDSLFQPLLQTYPHTHSLYDYEHYLLIIFPLKNYAQKRGYPHETKTNKRRFK